MEQKQDTPDRSARRLDDAARAAWLYYIQGRTQDEIAGIMSISRQSAQRLVSLAMAQGLVKVRIDHPISRCLDLARRLTESTGLATCEVVPDLPGGGPAAIAHATADAIERALMRPDPLVMGLGTGRTLRAAVEALPRIDCARHRIVSLTGNIAPDGSTAYYNVLFTVTDKVTAPTYPLPMPVVAASAEERDALLAQKTVAATLDLARRADIAFVGIGRVDDEAPLLLDGFVTGAELDEMRAGGAAGEILGWVFDAAGRPIEGGSNARVSSAPIGRVAEAGQEVIACAGGHGKLGAIRAAIAGRLITGLVTDEATAGALLG